MALEHPPSPHDLDAFHRQVASMVGVDHLARDLINLLMEISARISRTRRAVAQGSAVELELDLHAVDDAFGRALSITRAMSHGLLGPRPRGVLTSVSEVVCEIAALVGPTLPAGASLVTTYPSEPCVVACSPCRLRSSLVAVLASVVEGSKASGEVHVLVRTRVVGTNPRPTRLCIEVQSPGGAVARAPAAWALAVTAARELAQSLQAALTVVVDASSKAILSLDCALVC
jgi:hypothetical protein